MDKPNTFHFPQISLPVRRLLLLGLGGVIGLALSYAVLPTKNPAVSVALGLGLLIGVLAGGVGRSLVRTDSDDPLIQSDFSEEWPELRIAFRSLADSLRRLASQTDAILLEAAIVRLADMQEELRNLSAGRIVFASTEGWRNVYEQILRTADIKFYRSVAWMKNEDYWRDAPGQRSMQTNYELLDRGAAIERIFILSDFFWPAAALLPAKDIRNWLDEQRRRGIVLQLVRESALDAEPDLLCDFGIYGTRAAGTWELDQQCRTNHFTFDFSPEGIRLAEERWKRLSLYAVSYEDLLDQAPFNR